MNKKHHCNNPSSEQMHMSPEAETQNTPSNTPETAEENTQTPAEPSTDLQEALTECAAWKDKALRAQADMENLRKRMAHDMENHTKFAHGTFAKDLLPVADCLANALTCAHQELKNPDNKAFLKNMITGIEMVQKQLDDVLKKHGIEKMHPLGKSFDPNLHQVIGQVEQPDTPSGTVVQEMQTGYLIGGDRVLREALVLVAK